MDNNFNHLKQAVSEVEEIGQPGRRRNEQRIGKRYAFFAAISVCIIIGLAVGLGVGLTRRNDNDASSTTKPDIRGTPSFWQPTTNTTWNIALINPPTTFSASSVHLVYDLDLFDVPQTTINNLKSSSHKMVCYFSAGSYEQWRPDAKKFPKSALGNPLDGWPGERWLNTSDSGVRDIMRARLQLAKNKGCDGVDPDNIDGYENDPGFPLTKATAVDYIGFLSREAHALGMACGLKNGGDIVPQVVDLVEWELNEQCAQFNECAQYLPFVQKNKPVFQIEYTEQDPPPAAFVTRSCGPRTPKGFSTLIKHMKLGPWTATCPKGAVTAF